MALTSCNISSTIAPLNHPNRSKDYNRVYKKYPKIVSRCNVLIISTLCYLFSVALAEGQISFNSTEDTYTQSFNGLPSSGTFTWLDNVTIPGWYAATSLGAGLSSVTASAGTGTGGGLYSFGAASDSDRALGSIGSSSAGNMYWGVRFVNNTGTAITGFTIGYTGEQWRSAGTAGNGAQTVGFQYSLSATALKTGSYQGVPTLDFISPVTTGSAGSLNGNLGANQASVGPVTVQNILWLPGASLWVRFYDPDHSGTDHGLSVDNFSFSAAASSNAYDPPSGYYAAAQGLTGQALADALHGIITPHTVIPYDSTTQTDAMAALKVLDEDPSDNTKVRLVYTGTSILKTDSTWNREHLWPQSRGVGSNGADFSDLYNLRASSAAINSARGNKFFDISDTANANYHSPATSGASADTSTDFDSWQPSIIERGDVARSLMYMDIRYAGNETNTLDLFLQDVVNGTADMAVLTTLLQWSEQDPVSDEERRRNSLIYSVYQHNRNPFVDHPEYVDQLFGVLVRTALDQDLDGMPNYWETQFQFNPNNCIDAIGDADNDGISNLEEFWTNSDPTNSFSPATLYVDKSNTGLIQDGTALHPYHTIQAAITAVPQSVNTLVLVKSGTYPEHLDTSGKEQISIISSDGPVSTIIDGTTSDQFEHGPVVQIHGVQRATLIGFTIRNGNTAAAGAGINIDSASGQVFVEGNLVTNNISTNTIGGGGIYVKAARGTQLANNFVTLNQGVRGGGVLFASGNPQFWHNTVADNIATGGHGGGLSALTGAYPDVKANIIWGNTGSLESQIHQITAITNNILQGAASGTGNIAQDPQFVSSSGHNYHILPTSPAHNAANPLPVMIDYDRTPRPDVWNESKDIGADEISNENSDFDGDGMPDEWEYDNFSSLNEDRLGDYDHDGVYNYMDANPNNASIGIMQIHIVTPGNGTTVQ